MCKRKYAYCTLETMDKRKVVCVCVLLQETHVTNRSGLVGLRSATGLDLNLSNHTVGECLM